MRSYSAMYQGNILTATINNMYGRYVLTIYMQYQGRQNQIIQYSEYKTLEEAMRAMAGAFPGAYWRITNDPN